MRKADFHGRARFAEPREQREPWGVLHGTRSPFAISYLLPVPRRQLKLINGGELLTSLTIHRVLACLTDQHQNYAGRCSVSSVYAGGICEVSLLPVTGSVAICFAVSYYI